jgi:hypothetical protein
MLVALHLCCGDGQVRVYGATRPNSCRGARNLQRIVPQDIGPRTDVGRALARVVADSEFVTQDHAGDLGPQLFLRVALAAKRMREAWPVQCPSSCSAIA